jgi:hypothetical protein
MSTDKNIIETVREALFSDRDKNVYAVLDGASVPELPQVLWEHEPESVCLYRGELEPDMAQVAPYLVKLVPSSPFTDWILNEGWGNHWGIFAITAKEVDLRTVRRHFRRFLMVKDPEGKSIYFRYYDPRVLSVFLPTCNSEELKILFGPINCYLCEDEDAPVLVRLSLTDGELNTKRMPLQQIRQGG